MDTSATFAFVDARDVHHEPIRAAFRDLHAGRHEVFLTNFVLAESHALIGSRRSWEAARKWLVGHGRPVVRVLAEDEAAALDIIVSHQDKSYSYVDATSFAVMDRLGVKTALTLDRHFRQYGFETLPA
jgi:predicted nucleic acid-binding protein